MMPRAASLGISQLDVTAKLCTQSCKYQLICYSDVGEWPDWGFGRSMKQHSME